MDEKRCSSDAFQLFKALLFKVCNIENREALKESLMMGFKADIAEVNRARILKSIAQLHGALTDILKEMGDSTSWDSMEDKVRNRTSQAGKTTVTSECSSLAVQSTGDVDTASVSINHIENTEITASTENSHLSFENTSFKHTEENTAVRVDTGASKLSNANVSSSASNNTCSSEISCGGETSCGDHQLMSEGDERDEARQIFCDPDLVQITAGKAEIDRRIAAFIERQRQKTNFENVREFCGQTLNAGSSCARVDAIFTPRAGSRSHIKVKRVVNHYGPQTERGHSAHLTTAITMCPSAVNVRTTDVGNRAGYSNCSSNCDGNSSGNTESNTMGNFNGNSTSSFHSVGKRKTCVPVGAAERLQTLEEHLNVDRSDDRDILMRLHNLEVKLLEIESQSVEYSHSNDIKRSRVEPQLSTIQHQTQQGSSEVTRRIEYLRGLLHSKAP